MNVLLDTNILTRAIQPAHPHHAPAVNSLDRLKVRGDRLCVVPQNMYEFWVVCTRPVGENGLGLSPLESQGELSKIKSLFELLPDTPQIFAEWERLVVR